MAHKNDPFVRTFDVSDPSQHPKGYTIYKVTYRAFNKSSPESGTEIIVWKRYNEFKKLHKCLRAIHSNLHLLGSFPSFPKATIFGRFDDIVIEGRCKSGIELLKFATLHPPLLKCQEFTNFFKGGTQVNFPSDDCKDLPAPSLKPIVAYNNPVINPPCFEESVDGASNRENLDANLGGVWQYRQAADSVSLNSGDSCSEDIDDLSVEATLHDGLNWISQNKNPLTNGDLLDLESDPVVPRSSQCSDTNSKSAESDTAEQISLESGAECSAKLAQTGHEMQRLTVTSPVASGIDEIAPYIYDASLQITKAHDAEAIGDYASAFDFYKSGIGILLAGVQGDVNVERRDAARRKTVNYLRRAEQIFKNHLANTDQDDQRWTVTSRISMLSQLDVGANLLHMPMDGLVHYRVLGVIGKVQLVLDCNTETVHVLKVLSKCSGSQLPCRVNVVPTIVPHMVRLHRFHESDNAIFLLLQHATGGRLWDYVATFMQSGGTGIIKTRDSMVAPMEKSLSSTSIADANVYSGRKLLSVKQPCLQFKLGDEDDDDDDDDQLQSTNNYSDLFSSYVTACQRSKSSVGLARHFSANSYLDLYDPRTPVTKSSERTENVDFLLTPNHPKIYSVTHSEPQSSDENKDSFTDEIGTVSVVANTKDDCDFVPDLATLDHHLLIANAQKLMEDVDETMRKSSEVFRRLSEQLESEHPNSTCVSRRRTSSLSNEQRTSRQRRPSRLSLRSNSNSISSPTRDLRLPNSMNRASSAENLDGGRSKRRHVAAVMEVARAADAQRAVDVRLPEASIRIWASEIVHAVASLHALGIICRDLNPNNILLGDHGHVLLSYFSQWDCVYKSIDCAARDDLYTAPEVDGIFAVTEACDWWSVGALLFELLTGKSLHSCHPGGIWSHTTLNIPGPLSAEAESLLQELLRYDHRERLGGGVQGAEAVRAHPFFEGVDWSQL